MRTTLKVTAIAVAAAAAFGLNSQAMADTAVYGKAHVSFASLGGTGAVTEGLNAASHASRFGLKNSTDLGNGMTAKYQLELEIDMTDGGAIKYRNTFAGLKGSFGEFRFGTHDTPHKSSTGKMDPFGDTYADYNNVINRDKRVGGLLWYKNKFGDVGFAAAYSGENDSDLSSASVDFKAGPALIALAYENDNAASKSYAKAGVSYDFGAGKVNLVWADDAGTAQYYLSGEFKMSDTMKLKAAYGDDGSSTSDNLMALGVSNKLGKKTEVYGLYAAGDLSKTNGLAKGASAIAVGLVHKF